MQKLPILFEFSVIFWHAYSFDVYACIYFFSFYLSLFFFFFDQRHMSGSVQSPINLNLLKSVHGVKKKNNNNRNLPIP